MEKITKNNETAQLGIGAVIGWVSVSDELPKEYKHRMSRDVLTIAGSKMSVKSYDWELGMEWFTPHHGNTLDGTSFTTLPITAGGMVS